jgi:hypothetical protein
MLPEKRRLFLSLMAKGVEGYPHVNTYKHACRLPDRHLLLHPARPRAFDADEEADPCWRCGSCWSLCCFAGRCVALDWSPPFEVTKGILMHVRSPQTPAGPPTQKHVGAPDCGAGAGVRGSPGGLLRSWTVGRLHRVPQPPRRCPARDLLPRRRRTECPSVGAIDGGIPVNLREAVGDGLAIPGPIEHNPVPAHPMISLPSTS